MTTTTNRTLSVLIPYPNLSRLVGAVLDHWPEHTKFMHERFASALDTTLPLSERIAELALKLSGDQLSEYCDGYRWMCNSFVAEDLYFRRTGCYRLSTFEEAYREVYSREDRMERYLKGILLSQVLWLNHAEAFRFYVERFLNRIEPGWQHLEIGPGHGLFMYFAACNANVRNLTGWDVSASSLSMTRKALDTFGVDRPFKLGLQNILESRSTEPMFDSVVMSEVLEHLDRPHVALDTVARVLKPTGLAFFNVPINSPAPDHIYYWGSPREVEQLMASRGFEIVETSLAPTTGYTIERALRRKVAVSVLMIARRAKTGSQS